MASYWYWIFFRNFLVETIKSIVYLLRRIENFDSFFRRYWCWFIKFTSLFLLRWCICSCLNIFYIIILLIIRNTFHRQIYFFFLSFELIWMNFAIFINLTFIKPKISMTSRHLRFCQWLCLLIHFIWYELLELLIIYQNSVSWWSKWNIQRFQVIVIQIFYFSIDFTLFGKCTKFRFESHGRCICILIWKYKF